MLRSYLRRAWDKVAPPRLYILGITRFSLVTRKTLTAFEATRGLSFEAAQKLIYEPARMEARFRLFEAVCLPTYRMMRQQHRHSVGIVLIAESMPKRYVNRLRSLAAGGAFRIVKVADTERPSEAMDRVIAKFRPRDRVYSYRLDDDDALSVDFIKTIRARANSTPDGTVISLDLGLSLRRVGPDEFAIQEREQPLIAIGLGVFCKPGAPVTPLGLGNHTRIEENGVPVQHVREPRQWLRLAHSSNDSRGRMPATVDSSAHLHDGIGLARAIGRNFPQISLESLRRISEF